MTKAAAKTANPIASRPRIPSARTLAGVILLVTAAILYALTLDNGLQPGELHGGDLITHQYAQVQARPSNAPGYPVYTLGGWLWFHGIRAALGAVGIHQPNPIPILSGYSMLWALLALGLLYEVICRVTADNDRARRNGGAALNGAQGNWPVAFLVSAFYAVTYFFWYYATTTEQYSSAIAHTLAILLVFLVWMRQPDSLWRLYALAFLCGLSLAHMLTVALIVPPIVVAVLWRRPSLLRSPKAVVGSVLAAVLPLGSYAFVYLRGSRHPEWWGSQEFTSATDWFWSFVSTAQGREELMWAFEPGRPFLGNGLPNLIGRELTWLMVIAGLVGVAYLRRPLRFVLFATLGLYLTFSWVYRFGNWFQVILPAYALLMIGVGAAADRWQAFAATRPPRNGETSNSGFLRAVAYAAPLVLLATATVWRFDASLTNANSRNRTGDTALERATLLLDAPLPDGSAIFASVDDALSLQYLTEVWGIRPDIQVVSSDQARDMIAQQPVYATWDAASTLREELGLDADVATTVITPDWVTLSKEGVLPDVFVGAAAEGVSIVELKKMVIPDIELSGYSVSPLPEGSTSEEARSAGADITLYWTIPAAGWPEDLAISVRPTLNGQFVPNPDDPTAVLVTDHAQPAQLLFEDSRVAAGGPVRDPYRITFPADSLGEAGIAVILYRRLENGFEDLARIDFPLDSIAGPK